MTIKKTYTRFMVGLFVGLFSFNILSSCSTVGRQLGNIEQHKAVEELVKKNKKSAHNMGVCPGWFSRDGREACPYCRSNMRFRVLAAGAAIACVGIVGSITWLLWPSAYPIENTMTNTTLPGNTTTGLVDTTLVNNVVGSAAETLTTVATTAATLLPTAGFIAALKPNGVNSNSVTSTTPSMPVDLDANLGLYDYDMEPGVGGPAISNPTVLSQEIIDDILAHGFSIGRMKYWIKKGLDVNASTIESRTLLMEVARRKLFSQVVWLVRNGADINAEDKMHSTPLMYALAAGRDAARIVKFLDKNGANLCVKNVKGRPLQSDIDLFNDIKLSEKFANCSLG